MKLELPLSAFETLYQRLERTRRTSTTVTVDRTAITTLLRDHQRCLKRLGELGEKLVDPAEPFKPVPYPWPDEMREPWDQPGRAA